MQDISYEFKLPMLLNRKHHSNTGIGCRCASGWRVIQDVGYYRRSSGGNHGDTLGRNGDIGLKCEVGSSK